jgi:hypothetical protein
VSKVREELKGRNLSFTEVAKLVEENWRNLAPGEKEPDQQQAFSAKERYNNERAEYKKTDNYRKYSQYLAELQARHSDPQQGMLSDIGAGTGQHSKSFQRMTQKLPNGQSSKRITYR